MKKIFMLFGALLLLLAQAKAQDCPFKVQMNVIPATCYNNGMVTYTLVDDAGDPLSAAPNGIGDVRIYYKLNETDSAQYGANWTGDWDTLLVDYGTYIVGVEASCADGHGGFTKVDTHTVLTIPTTYVKPEASALYVTATRLTDYGKRPTLSCMESGRIQLKIENGRFPYTVTVKRHGSNDIYRTVVFDTNQYSGNNVTNYNYKDYYTIDSLPAGDWDCYVVDGCEYGLPRTGQIVQAINFPKLVGVDNYTSTGNFEDSNVVKISATLDRDYSYYTELMPLYLQYRFSYEGQPVSEEDWKPFPSYVSGGSGGNFRMIFYDTAEHISNYCELWDKDITFEYKITGCGDTIISRTFQIHKPIDHYVKDFSDSRDSTISDMGSCTNVWKYHRWYYNIYYYYPGICGPNSYSTYCSSEGYYYTHPLTWIYTDTVTGQIIKQEQVDNIFSPSYLYSHEVEALYGSFQDSPLTIHVERKLVDSKGCLIYSTIDPLTYYYDTGTEISDWSMDWQGNDHCCDRLRYVRVFEHFHSNADPDGTTIRLVRSPYNNRYNFEAVYSSENRSWTVNKDNLLNMALVEGARNGLSLSIKDYCLPSGPYAFEIVTPCDSFYWSHNISFADIYETVNVPEPEFSFFQQCTDRYISYTGPDYYEIVRNTSPTTGEELPPQVHGLQTTFQIMSGPVGGYDGSPHYKGESVRVSMPGQYVVAVSPSGGMCGATTLYDTIVYDGSTVDFDYALALLCDSNSTSGNAYVHGSNGTPPYTYTLYDQANKTGNILGTNSTGIFTDVPMRSGQRLSCLVQDACDAYFHVNLIPSTVADMQKVWFDGGLTATETCEGTYIRVNALEIGSLLQYDWDGPDGFHSTVATPDVFVPRGASSGWYKVAIQNTGCAPAILDSIYLTVQEAPTLTLLPDATVCPGEEVTVKFVPQSPMATADHINFSIAYENENGVETRNYTALPGDTVTDTYVTYSAATVYPVRIDDGRCQYAHSDTSIHINMRTDIANACTILTTHDTVCYGYDGHLTAKSTLEPPYTLRWYGDYDLTDFRKEDVIDNTTDWSYYDTLELKQRALLYVSVEKDGTCPTVYGIPTHSMVMGNGTSTVECGKTYRLFDSGGPDGNYPTSEISMHTFISSDGAPVTLHFDMLDLSQTSHLFVISGAEPLTDSILIDLTYGSPDPGIIFSNGNVLTLLFMSGMKAAPGWNAVVERSPGVAVAEVRPKNEVTIRDEVCQSQTRTYDDPYRIAPAVASLDDLNAAMRKAGTYTFTKNLRLADIHGCDSIVNFIFTVQDPPRYDTTVVTTNMHGGSVSWYDSTYTESGRYTYMTAQPDGCDFMHVLNFIVLQIDTSDNDICQGDSTIMGISVTEPDMSWNVDATDDSLSYASVGDIYCTDGTIMSPEEFAASSGKIPQGVIFYVDTSRKHGLMTMLSNGKSDNHFMYPHYGQNYWIDKVSGMPCPSELYCESITTERCRCRFPDEIIREIFSYEEDLLMTLPSITDPHYAVLDLNGRENTENLLLARHTFDSVIPAYWPRDIFFGEVFNVIYMKRDFALLRYAIGDERGPWWLPSAGEMTLLMNNADIVNRSIITAVTKCISDLYPGYTVADLLDDEEWGDFLVAPCRRGYLTSTLVFLQDGLEVSGGEELTRYLVGINEGTPYHKHCINMLDDAIMDNWGVGAMAYLFRGVTDF